MQNLKGKKLLVIGGAFQHCKVVEAAHEMGVTVIVTDYLPKEQAPAKLIADKYYIHNITDIDEIIEMCRTEKVDGVIATSLDACQKPYQQVCEKLGVPCFGTSNQYKILTEKNILKNIVKKAAWTQSQNITKKILKKKKDVYKKFCFLSLLSHAIVEVLEDKVYVAHMKKQLREYGLLKVRV